MPTIAIGVVAIMALISVRLYGQYGTPQFSANVIKLSDVTDASMTVTFKVHKPSGEAATCTVDALAYNRERVGTAEVNVPEGKDIQVTHTLTTIKRAYVANVPSCRAVSR